MNSPNQINKPSKDDRLLAIESYKALHSALKNIHSLNPEIEIQETQDKIKIPLKALNLLTDILKAMSEGKPISIVPLSTEVTTQKAAEILGCSRPHVVKLLEKGEIEFTKVGRHRRIKYEDLIQYKLSFKKKQRERLIAMMRSDEESGLYDS
jgi:excisionase family DNA binding protein